MSSRVSLTGGVRYTDEHKDLDNVGGVYRLGTATLLDPTSFYKYVDNAAFHAWTPKGSLQVELSRDTFVYASATRGFKSGGFNPTARTPGLAFNPEFAWSYEGGLKQTMAGGRIRVNTAVFSMTTRICRCSRSLPRRRRHQQRRSGNRQRRRGRGVCGSGAQLTARGPFLLARRDLRPVSLSGTRKRHAARRRGWQSAEQRP